MEIVILLILILLNGFFALSEIALVSSKRSRLEQQRMDGKKGANVALRLLDDAENFLSAIQVGITLIGIVTGVYGGMNISDDITPFFEKFQILYPFAGDIALVVTVLLITYVSIVIGELVPKTIALSNPERIAILVAPTISCFSRIFYPFVKVLSISTNFVNRLIGIKKQAEHITETELRHLIKLASSEGVIKKEQNILHEKVFYFADKKAKHIMTHRTDVEWVDISKTNEEVRNRLLHAQHSKVVCSQDNLDELKGIIFIKDFYKQLLKTGTLNLPELIIKPLIVPENVDAQKVLNLFRQKQVHMCLVVNEYGGFEGLITLHDIMENIVGHIPDEGEISEPDIFIRDDKSVLVNGDAPIEIVGEIIPDFEVDYENIDYSTVAGFIIDQIGSIPQIGDRYEFQGYTFEIVDLDGNKIDKILISKTRNTD